MMYLQQKAKESAANTHSYSLWSYSEPEQVVTEGVLGQFVVQYDVARPKDGEILVSPLFTVIVFFSCLYANLHIWGRSSIDLFSSILTSLKCIVINLGLVP